MKNELENIMDKTNNSFRKTTYSPLKKQCELNEVHFYFFTHENRNNLKLQKKILIILIK